MGSFCRVCPQGRGDRRERPQWGADGLLFLVGCRLDLQPLTQLVRGGRVGVGGGEGPRAWTEGQPLSDRWGPRSALTKPHGAGVQAMPVRTS